MATFLFPLSFLFILLPILINCSSLCGRFNHKCDSNPLHILLETEYRLHPFRNVLVGKDIPFFTLANITLGVDHEYIVAERINRGRFGLVYQATHEPTGDQVVLKLFNRSEQSEKRIFREIQILEDMKDAPNHLPMRDVLRCPEKTGEMVTILVFDLFESGDFKQVYPTLTKYQMKSFIFDILRNLNYANKKGLMHRDIKPPNLLMNPEKLDFKVIDWGYGEYYVPGKRYSVRAGTLLYASPEILLGNVEHDYAIDIWSTGVILAEMMFKKIHFFRADPAKYPKDPTLNALQAEDRAKKIQLEIIAQVLGTAKLKQVVDKFKGVIDEKMMELVGNYRERSLTEFINEENKHLVDARLLDLLGKMLKYDPTKRITAYEALRHPIFHDIRFRLKYGIHYPQEDPDPDEQSEFILV